MDRIGNAIPLLPALAVDASPEERAAHRQQWLALRRPGIGASEIAAVLGSSPWASYFSLWWQKKEGWEFDPNESMEWGLRSEDMMAQKFAEDHPEFVVSRPAALYVHKRRTFMLCSPDRLAFRHQYATGPDDRYTLMPEPVELKTDEAGDGWGTPGTAEVPEHHRMQVLWQCAVFGARRGHLVRYARKKYTEYVIDAAEPRMGEWIEEAARFLESVQLGEAPDPDDGHKATTATLMRLYPEPNEKEPPVMVGWAYVNRYLRLCDEEKEVKAALREVKNQIRGQLGNASAGVDGNGRIFVTRSRHTRRGYTVEPTTVDELRRKKS